MRNLIKILIVSYTLLLSAHATTTLVIKKVTIQVNGKPATVFHIAQPDGTWGFEGVKGQEFDAIVKNQTDIPTVIHWHGLIVPNDQDGVPYVTQPPIEPGKEYHYHFKLLQAGTYWMHSHFDLQVQSLLSAPFIIKDPNDTTKEKDVVMFLSDFSFKPAKDILYSLQHNSMANMKMPMPTNKPDLVDVKYDAFLTNYRTLQHAEIVQVNPGETIRLRIIDGSANTNFIVNTGQLSGLAIAADGEKINPIPVSSVQLAVGQRMDVRVTLPEQEGVYPILAQGEGTNMQTGLILVTRKAIIPHYSEQATTTAGALSYAQEEKLHAPHPLSRQQPGQTLTVKLEGDMMSYVWKINNQTWPNISPLVVQANKRVEIVFDNQSSMEHPMHLHGHVFEVIEINGKKITAGAMRDTVLVMPHSIVKVQFNTTNPGNWMLHCHMLYHQMSGMMTLMSYQGMKIPPLRMM